jgi:transposase
MLDNASIHHDRDFLDLILECGAIYLFLHPCPPDHNPIERGFAAIKRWIISHWADESAVSSHAILNRALNEAVDPSTKFLPRG